MHGGVTGRLSPTPTGVARRAEEHRVDHPPCRTNPAEIKARAQHPRIPTAPETGTH
jgi:hypothetical protein